MTNYRITRNQLEKILRRVKDSRFNDIECICEGEELENRKCELEKTFEELEEQLEIYMEEWKREIEKRYEEIDKQLKIKYEEWKQNKRGETR